MRDPRDPGGEYERDAGFGFVAPEGHVWTDEDYIGWVLRKREDGHIGWKVREVIAQRERLGFERYHRPLTKDTCEDNLQEAIEENADELFYLVAAHEKQKEMRVEIGRLRSEVERLQRENAYYRIGASVPITSNDISCAWENVANKSAIGVLYDLGIVPCGTCGGAGVDESGEVVPEAHPLAFVPCPECCGNGWAFRNA